MSLSVYAKTMVSGKKVDGQKIDGQKVDGQKVDGQKVDICKGDKRSICLKITNNDFFFSNFYLQNDIKSSQTILFQVLKNISSQKRKKNVNTQKNKKKKTTQKCSHIIIIYHIYIAPFQVHYELIVALHNYRYKLIAKNKY